MNRWMPLLSSPRRAAQVGMIGAVMLAVYAVLKPLYGPRDGWVLPFVPAADSWLVYHLGEVVPVALLLVGIVAIYRYQRPVDSWLARIGFLAITAGAIGTVVTHSLEHLTEPLLIPMPTLGEQNLWMWAYYGAWFTVAAGIGLVGVTADRTPVLDRRTKLLWIATIPLGFVFLLVFFLVVGSNLTQGFKLAIALSIGIACLRLSGRPTSGEATDQALPADD